MSTNNQEFENEIDRLFEQEDVFRPLSDGLGFDQVKKKISITESSKVKTQKKTRDESHAVEDFSLHHEKQEQSALNVDDLSTIKKPEHSKKAINNLYLMRRFFAFTFDVILMSIVFILLIGMSLYITSIPVMKLESLLVNDAHLVHWLFTSGLYFALYFGFFDMTKLSSPGKYLLGLCVIDDRFMARKARLWQTLLRAIITFILLPFGGLFQIFAIDTVLTRTRITEQNFSTLSHKRAYL